MTEDPRVPTGGTPDGTPPWRLRVSDAERREVAEALAQHFGDGRLDQVELDERMEKAMGAKTRGDLAALLADLPSLDAAPPANPVALVAQRPRRHLARDVGAVVAVLVAASLLQHALFWRGWLWPGAFGHPQVPLPLVALVALFLLRRSRRHRAERLATRRPDAPLA